MKHITPDVNEELAKICKTYPKFTQWVDDWYIKELRDLPSTRENVAQAQGRCQVLAELSKALNDAPSKLK